MATNDIAPSIRRMNIRIWSVQSIINDVISLLNELNNSIIHNEVILDYISHMLTICVNIAKKYWEQCEWEEFIESNVPTITDLLFEDHSDFFKQNLPDISWKLSSLWQAIDNSLPTNSEEFRNALTFHLEIKPHLTKVKTTLTSVKNSSFSPKGVFAKYS